MSSFFPWMGGKSRVAKRLCELLPEHGCYVEVFAGAANLLFVKEKSKVEVINSLINPSMLVINFSRSGFEVLISRYRPIEARLNAP